MSRAELIGLVLLALLIVVVEYEGLTYALSHTR